MVVLRPGRRKRIALERQGPDLALLHETSGLQVWGSHWRWV